ncbi:MAG: M12 family metallo-peptidase [Verrucomicrobiota bacterium]
MHQPTSADQGLSWPGRVRRPLAWTLAAAALTVKLIAEPTPPALFVESDSPIVGVLNERSARLIQHRRVMRLNPDVWEDLRIGGSSAGKSYRLNVSGPGDIVQFSAVRDLPSGVRCYAGPVNRLEGSQVILMRKAEMVAGTVLMPGEGSYQLVPRADGSCELNQLDPRHLPQCGVSGRPEIDQEMAKMELALGASRPPVKPGAVAAAPLGIIGHEEIRPLELELMVVYTSTARATVGTDGMELLIQVGVEEANLALRNSETGVQLRLVHTAEVNYPETGNLASDLWNLRSPQDGLLDEVLAWREQYQADLVCLVVEASDRYEGIALFPTGADSGFSVVERFHLTGFGLLGHEIGHNLGCDHDRESRTGGGAFPYSYGHRLTVEGSTYRTLMCYAPGWPIANFSNPNVLFRGVSTGLGDDQPEPADNARTIRALAASVDAYAGVIVQLVAPRDGTILPADSIATLSASVVSSEGPVERVEFFDGADLIGVSSAMPYQFDWNEPAPGNHKLWAAARLASGTQVSSRQITIGISPSNDAFARRLELVGSNVVGSAVMDAATSEPGEPTPFGLPARTVWWSWTSPTAATVEVTTTGNGLPTGFVAIFTGQQLDDLQPVARSEWNARSVYFEAIAGQAYAILVQATEAEGKAWVNLRVRPPPPNDAFADAARTTAAPGAFSGTTVAATAEVNEPVIGARSHGHSVWYAWSPPTSGLARVSISGTDNSPAPDYAIFAGAELQTLALVADAGKARQGFQTVGGTTYWIGVDGDYGAFFVQLSFTGAPPNDRFDQAFPLGTSSSSILSVNTQGASREPNEPVHGSVARGHSIWWSWRAGGDGGIQLSLPTTPSTGSPIGVAVYEGSELAGLRQVGARDFSGTYLETLVVPVKKGTNYFIAVDAQPSSLGWSYLRLAFKTSAGNDTFKRLSASAPLRFSGTTLGATAQPEEPNHAGRPPFHSIWWTWTCRTKGLIAASVDATGESLPRLAIYTGTTLTNLTWVADNRFNDHLGPTVLFPAANGQTFQIALDEETSSFGCSLVLNYVTPPPNDDFATAARLQPQLASVPVTGTTLGATAEQGEPDHSGLGSLSHSVWYTWVSDASGWNTFLAGGRSTSMPEVSYSTLRLLPEPLVCVYVGDRLETLTLVARGVGSATFESQRGRTYHIAIEATDGATQDFMLSLAPLPSNDQFDAAAPLNQPPAIVQLSAVTLRAATREPNEPAHDGAAEGHSLWWTFKPVRSGAYVWSSRQALVGSGAIPVQLIKAAYSGTALTNLTLVGSNHGPEDLIFPAVAGARYYLVVDLRDPRVSLNSTQGNLMRVSLGLQPAFIDQKKINKTTADFVIGSTSGQRFNIETSTDLTEWAPLGTTQGGGVDLHLRESLPTAPQKFYRIVVLPAAY